MMELRMKGLGAGGWGAVRRVGVVGLGVLPLKIAIEENVKQWHWHEDGGWPGRISRAHEGERVPMLQAGSSIVKRRNADAKL